MCSDRLLFPLHIKIRVDAPVFFRDEGIDFILPVADHAERHGLNAAGRKAALDLCPQKRTDAVPDHAVQHAARLLRIDKIHINFPRMPDGLLHRVLRDFVERDAGDLFVLVLLIIEPECRDEMPGNGLPLAVRVGCEINAVRLLHFLAERCQQLTLSADGDIFRLIIMLDVNAHLALRKVADMPLRRDHLVA